MSNLLVMLLLYFLTILALTGKPPQHGRRNEHEREETSRTRGKSDGRHVVQAPADPAVRASTRACSAGRINSTRLV